MTDEDFYEDDEPIEDILAITSRPPDGLTGLKDTENRDPLTEMRVVAGGELRMTGSRLWKAAK